MAPIDEALEDLALQETPNYSATARKYGVDHMTLSRRHKGKCVSRAEYHSKSGFLSLAQTRFLINYIKKLSEQGLPPTPTMVQQFTLDMTGKLPRKN